jgi:pSer/pThr/pTyr-binding forkhead associated (FHA) protein
MRVVLEIVDGPYTGRTVELNSGQALTVGRTAKSQLMLPYDNFLSGLHFSIDCADSGCVLRDNNSSNGTWINGNRVLEGPVQPGDQISAGQTRFRLKLEAAEPLADQRSSTVMFSAPRLEDLQAAGLPPTAAAIDPGVLTPQQQAFVSYLKLLPAPLFAIANASIEDRVPNWLIGSGEVYQFLAEGMTMGEVLPPGAYLTYLPATSQLLPKLVKESWGRNFCVFFTCMHPFSEVRKHLRQLLLLSTEDGRRFFFRYFDPRILQAFLPACSTQELTHFFGPVHAFIVQDSTDPSKLIEFSMTPQGLGGKVMTLT